MQLALVNGGTAIIDDDVFEKRLTLEVWQGEFYTFRICDFTWRHKANERIPYVVTITSRGGKQCCVRLHRLVMEAPKGILVDHINRDVLLNTRENLRFADHTTNNRNRAPKQKERNRIYTNPLTGQLLYRPRNGSCVALSSETFHGHVPSIVTFG